MKYLIIIILLFGCSKTREMQHQSLSNKEITEDGMRRFQNDYSGDDKRSNPNQFYHTCARILEDQTGGQVKGIAVLVNVEKLRLGNAKIKSWWLAGRYHYYTTNPNTGQSGWQTDWVQWGYAVDKGGLFQAFYVYHVGGVLGYGQAAPLDIIYSNEIVPLDYRTDVRFEIKNIPGTTYWSCSRNNQIVFAVDLKVEVMDGSLESCTESWGSSSFGSIVHADYFDYFIAGQWSHLWTAQIASASWGIRGRNQDSTFAISEHEFGGRYEEITNYYLW